MKTAIRIMISAALMAAAFFTAPAAAETFDRPWQIHLIHHTHLDIGYTHPQEEVMKKQRAIWTRPST